MNWKLKKMRRQCHCEFWSWKVGERVGAFTVEAVDMKMVTVTYLWLGLVSPFFGFSTCNFQF